MMFQNSAVVEIEDEFNMSVKTEIPSRMPSPASVGSPDSITASEMDIENISMEIISSNVLSSLLNSVGDVLKNGQVSEDTLPVDTATATTQQHLGNSDTSTETDVLNLQ